MHASHEAITCSPQFRITHYPLGNTPFIMQRRASELRNCCPTRVPVQLSPFTLYNGFLRSTTFPLLTEKRFIPIEPEV